MDDAIQIKNRWYVLATAARADERTRVLKHGDLMGVFDRFGDIVPIGAREHGLYYEGTRFLSRYELRIGGRRPMLLNSWVMRDNSLLAIDLTTPDLPEDGGPTTCKGEIHVFRGRLLWREDEGPTLYPVACSPQAWASASVFGLLQACLGLSFDATRRQAALRPPEPARLPHAPGPPPPARGRRNGRPVAVPRRWSRQGGSAAPGRAARCGACGDVSRQVEPTPL